MTTHRAIPRTPLIAVAAILAGLATLTACSGSASDGSSASTANTGDTAGSVAARAPVAANGFAADAQVATKQAEDSTTSSPVLPGTAKRVRTGELTVQVTNLQAAVDRLTAVAAGLDGMVSAESSSFPTAGKGTATLTLRVPEPKLDAALDQAATAGRELRRTTTSEDVTATLADLGSRVASQRASVDRIRALMQRATKLQDVVLLEGELSRRESDLEAQEASQRALADQADLATATILLQTSPTVVAAPKPDHGFLAGLRHGIGAVQASTDVVLTVLGALLPVTLVLLLLGYPAFLLYRRYARRTVNAEEAATPATPATPVTP